MEMVWMSFYDMEIIEKMYFFFLPWLLLSKDQKKWPQGAQWGPYGPGKDRFVILLVVKLSGGFPRVCTVSPCEF